MPAWPDVSPTRHAASLCISPGAGPGKPIPKAPWLDCATCHSLPDGLVSYRTPTGQLKVPTESRESGSRWFPLAYDLPVSPAAPDLGRQPPLDKASKPRTRSNPTGSKPHHPLVSPLIPSPIAITSSHRWIRAYSYHFSFPSPYQRRPARQGGNPALYLEATQ